MAKNVVLKITQKGAKKTLRSLSKVSSGLANIGKKAALVSGGLGVLSVKLAGDFQKSLLEVSTLMDKKSVPSLAKMSKELRSVASTSGLALSSLSKAKYDIVSAGFSNAADSAKVLEASAKLAVGGVTSAAEAADLLTTSLNAFGLEASQSTKVSDTLFTTVKLGKTTMGELAGSLGRVLPFAKSMNLSLDDVGASMATMTAAGINTAESATALVGAINALSAPGDSAAKAMSEAGIGVKRFDDGTVDLINTIGQFRGLDPEEIKAFIPNIRAIASIQTMANNFDTLKQNVSAFNKSAQESGATEDAFNKMSQAFNTQFSILINNMQSVGIELGNVIIEKIQPKIEQINKIFKGLGDIGFDNIAKSIAENFETVLTGLANMSSHVFNIIRNEAFLMKISIMDAINPFNDLSDTIAKLEEKTKAAFTADIARIGLEFKRVTNEIVTNAEIANLKQEQLALKSQESGDVFEQSYVDALKQLEKFDPTLKNITTSVGDLNSSLKEVKVPENLISTEGYSEQWSEFSINFAEGLGMAFANAGDKNQEFWSALGGKMQESLQTTNSFAQATNGIFEAQYNYRKQLLDNEQNDAIRQAQKIFNNKKAKIIEENTVNGQLTAAGQEQLRNLEQTHNASIQNTKEEFQQKDLDLRRKMKPAKIAQAISDTALGVAKALGSTIPPFNFALAALVAAQGALQVKTIQAQEFASGGIVQGVGNKDTVPAMLTPGEVILNQAQQENLVGGMGGITLNISAPLVDETIVDTIIPAIERAQKMNLA